MRRTPAFCILLAACHGTDDEPPPAPVELAWSPCAVVTGGTDTGAACGEADVPARWAEPDGPRVRVFVKRIGNALAPTQVWMLNGGPGASGADFDPLAEQLARDGSLVFYLPDHRGTGRSTRLSCAAEADTSPGGMAVVDGEWEACIDELRARYPLDGFTTTEAARDLAWMIEQTRREGQAVNVWGGSYGTRWAQRYLQLEPAQASSVTMLGVVPADRHMADYDATYDRVAAALLTRCGEDAFCASRLGTDPAARARAIWESLDAGHCAAAGVDKRMLRTFFAGLLLWSWHERALIPATLYRIERCGPSDVAALRYLRATLTRPSTPGVTDRLFGRLLGLHVTASEFWPARAPSLDELRAIDERALASFGSAPRIAERIATWPRYAPDSHAGGYPDTALPVLIMNGELDPATTADGAREVARHYTRPHQSLVIGPDATHTFVTPTRAGYWCFGALMIAFARDPHAPPIPCTQDMLPIDFRGAPELGSYFGTTDAWDGGPTAIPRARPALLDTLRWRVPL